MLQPLLDRAMAEVDVALASAKERHDLTLDDVDAFILVGGSSRIPQVARALAGRYKKPIKSNLNPDEIVAMGAARMALNFEPSLEWVGQDDVPLRIDTEAARPPEELVDTNIKDVVSHTLGIGLKDDIYDPLDPQGSRHPAQGRPPRLHHRAGQPNQYLRSRLPGRQPQGEPELSARRRRDRRPRRGAERVAPVPGDLRTRRRRDLLWASCSTSRPAR